MPGLALPYEQDPITLANVSHQQGIALFYFGYRGSSGCAAVPKYVAAIVGFDGASGDGNL